MRPDRLDCSPKATDYRVGDHLPPGALSAMAQAITSQSAEPELWIGTSGEGMLAFDGTRFRHLRPVDPPSAKRHRRPRAWHRTSAVRNRKGGLLSYDGKNLSYLHDSLARSTRDVPCGVMKRICGWARSIAGCFIGAPDRSTRSTAFPISRYSRSRQRADGAVYAGTALGIAVIRANRVERTIGDGLFAKTLSCVAKNYMWAPRSGHLRGSRYGGSRHI